MTERAQHEPRQDVQRLVGRLPLELARTCLGAEDENSKDRGRIRDNVPNKVLPYIDPLTYKPVFCEFFDACNI